MKLFAIYIGGEMQGANIEVHDVRFVVAPSIEETYAILRSQWWGVPRSLHIDCWAELTHADGYDITLSTEPSADTPKLYFVNLGGYEPIEFAERHRNVFVVAESESKAKTRALRQVRNWIEPHRDDLYEAEHVFALDCAADEQRLFIHLTPTEEPREIEFTCQYIPIRKNS